MQASKWLVPTFLFVIPKLSLNTILILTIVTSGTVTFDFDP
jgi:hypothetical protein